jgi:nitrite reductase (NADH) small subunit
MGFVRVAKVATVPPGQILEVHVAGKNVAVANVGGNFYAISNTCLHRGGPLGQGPLEGTMVTCPWHGWAFDVTSGKLAHNQAAGVACYAVEIRDDEVFVDVREELVAT